MTEALRQWVVELGWAVDTAGMSKAELAAKQAEDRITAENARALAQRKAQENTARQERIAADLAAGRKLSEDDVQFVAEQEKRRRTAAEEAHKREAEGFKKSSALREEQFKLASQNFLRLSGVAQAFATGLSGAIGALPFGGMILGIQRSASNLSNLAVQAQRVGSSAAHIQRFVHAMRFAGVDEGQANAALEGFASRIKSNEPGFRKALEGIGIRTTDADGKPLDIEELAEKFGNDFLRKQDYTTAHNWAEKYGIGDDALNAFRNGQFAKGTGDYDDRAKTFGFDADKASKDAREVSQAWLKVETDFKLVRDRLQVEFFVPLANSLDALAKKMEENPKQVESIGRAMEALGVLLAARTLPPLANLAVKLAGLGAILSGSVGTFLGIVANPVVALGASAESTPGAGIPADAAERAKVAEENRRLTDEANRKQGSTGSFWQDSWSYLKGKLGFGDDQKVAADIATTAEATKKLADKAEGVGGSGGFGGVSASTGGVGGSGSHVGGGSSPGATLGDRGQARRLAGGGAGAGPIDGNLPTGNVPGASGYGLKNAYWRGALGAKGEGGYLGPKEMFDYLKSQGASDNEALLLTGAAASESSFNPNAKHDPAYPGGPPTGHGLFGHKDTRLDMRGKTWREQSVAALAEMRRMLGGRVNAARSPEELTDLQMHYEGPRGYHRSTPRAGDNYMGRLNSIRRFSVMADHPQETAPTAMAPVPPGTPAKAVTDAEVFAARQRLKAGGTDPRDRALVDRYLKEQNAPKDKTSGLARHLDNLALIMQHRDRFATLMTAGHDPQRYAYSNTSNVRHGDFTRNGDTFNIQAKDTKGALDAVQKLSARRDYEDRIRYGQRSQG